MREVIELELLDDRSRVGELGTGILVAPLSAAIGLDTDVTFVVGLAEGVCPTGLTQDALLPDVARAATAGALPANRDRLDREHRHLLAAFASGGAVAASFPRGDLRGGGSRLPSRWLLPTLRELADEPTLGAADWTSCRGSWLDGSPSYAARIIDNAAPLSEQEWRLRTLSATGGAVNDDVALARAVELGSARRSDVFTRFDGNLSSVAGSLPDLVADAITVSPTRLEEWVGCPHTYFVRRLLRVEALDPEDDLGTISPADRGSLLHAALDDFFSWVATNGGPPGPTEHWSDEHHVQLLAIGRRWCEEFEQLGLTGHPTLWARDRSDVLDDLARVLGTDDEVRRGERRRQVRSELTFGRTTPAVRIPLPDGRAMHFSGSADRVDLTDDGTLVVVDYKSGKADGFKLLNAENPDGNGSKLQLPVYAYAALQEVEPKAAAVRAEYWFIGRSFRGQRIGYDLTQAVRERFGSVLSTIGTEIARGIFPHNPPVERNWSRFPACKYCDPDGLGTVRLRRAWDRKRPDPALDPYLALTEPSTVVTP